MLKRFLAAFLAFGLFVGGLFAVEGVVVKREKGDLTVKVGTEDKVFKLEKGVKIIDADGTELKGKKPAASSRLA
jgi:hypothetical protein